MAQRDEEERKKQIEQITAEINELHALTQHAGWKRVLSRLEHMETEATQMIKGATDPTTCAREAGMMILSREIAAWPTRQITYLKNILQRAAEDARGDVEQETE